MYASFATPNPIPFSGASIHLASNFEKLISRETLAALMGSPNSIYVLSSDFRLVFFNEAYRQFALDNDGADVLVRWHVGTPVLAAFSPPLRPFFESLYRRALGGSFLVHDYVCSNERTYRRIRAYYYGIAHRFIMIDNAVLAERAHQASIQLVDAEVRQHYLNGSETISPLRPLPRFLQPHR